MAEMYAQGCPACNRDVAYAHERMMRHPGYLDAEGWHQQKYSVAHYVTLDGEDMMSKHVMAIVPGADGWLRAHHCEPGHDADPRAVGPHLCACGSDHLAEVVWRGAVAIKERA